MLFQQIVHLFGKFDSNKIKLINLTLLYEINVFNFVLLNIDKTDNMRAHAHVTDRPTDKRTRRKKQQKNKEKKQREK